MIKKITMVFFFLIMSLASCQEKKDQNGIDLNVTEFEKHISEEDAYLLDVRTPDEVSKGKIEGAAVLDIMGSEFKEKYSSLPKDKTLYIYCRSGNRSRKAVKFLKENGYNSVYHLDGGIKAWVNANKKIK